MNKENAKIFLEQVMKDEALRARIADKEPADVVEIAKELGFDVTADDLAQAERALRNASGTAEAPVELAPGEMDMVVGGSAFLGEDAPDGHEMGCIAFYHHYNYQLENNIWCKRSYYCKGVYEIEIDWDTES